jgi:hypothetical protein
MLPGYRHLGAVQQFVELRAILCIDWSVLVMGIRGDETYGRNAASWTPSTTSYALPYAHQILAPIGSIVRLLSAWILPTVSFASLSAVCRESVLGVDNK